MPPIETILAENQALKGKVETLNEKVASLEVQLEWLKKQMFGPGKNERQDRAQLMLKLGHLEAQIKAAATQTITYERRTKGTPRQTPQESFEHLPVKETIELVPDEVKADPDLYERIGEETTFEVDITQPQLYKRVIVRPKYRHRLDRSRPPVVASALQRLMIGGYASAGLVSWVVISKYCHHLPLARLEKMSERWGAKLSRQSMSDWVAAAAERLEPIYRRMKAALLAGKYLQADETPIRCQDPDHPSGKTFEAWLWAINHPDSDVVFVWRLSRRHGEVESLLAGFKGVLQVDGFPGYANFVKDNPDVVRVGCLAHARRYFHDALEDAPVAASFMLRLFGHLYHMENEWEQRQIARPQRARLRERDFALTLRLLKKAAILLAKRARPTSPLGEACKYLLNQWDSLVAVCTYGDARLDTNSIENSIRPSAIGKKNFLFVGHPDAGDRTAILYSIIVSCQRRQVDPLAYLRDVLTRLPSLTNQDDLDVLMPARWQPQPTS